MTCQKRGEVKWRRMSGREGLQALWEQPQHPPDVEIWLPGLEMPGKVSGLKAGEAEGYCTWWLSWLPGGHRGDLSHWSLLRCVLWNTVLWTAGWGWEGCLYSLSIFGLQSGCSVPPSKLSSGFSPNVGVIQCVNTPGWSLAVSPGLGLKACCCGPCLWSPCSCSDLPAVPLPSRTPSQLSFLRLLWCVVGNSIYTSILVESLNGQIIIPCNYLAFW